MEQNNNQFFNFYFNGQPFNTSNNQEDNLNAVETYNNSIIEISNNLDHCKYLKTHFNNKNIHIDNVKQREYIILENLRRKYIDQFDVFLILFINNNNIDIFKYDDPDHFLNDYLKQIKLSNINNDNENKDENNMPDDINVSSDTSTIVNNGENNNVDEVSAENKSDSNIETPVEESANKETTS